MKKFFSFFLFLFLAAAALFVVAGSADAAAKYVFLFIGDGMGPAQVNLAEAYLAGARAREAGPARTHQLNMTGMPISGVVATASLSGVTDSAAAGTAIATGHKTINDAVAMDPRSGERWPSLLVEAKRRGMKTGVVTSAFLQDATPAAFTAHAEKRTSHYQIGLELCESGVDFFGGGGFRSPSGRDKKSANLIDIAKKNGYAVTTDAKDFFALAPEHLPAGVELSMPKDRDASSRVAVSPRRASKAMAIHPNLSAGSMPFAIDEGENVPEMALSDFVRRAVMMLDGDAGFVLVVEGGRIDIACHANDAAATAREVIAFDEAIGAALEFASARPDETLVVVTADHETGGLSIAGSDPASIFSVLSRQKGSYLRFEGRVSPNGGKSIDELIEMARAYFSAGSIERTKDLEAAYRYSMMPSKERPTKEKSYARSYATYDPFTAAAMKQANAALSITWKTFYHTGTNVPIFAQGVGADEFIGSIDNTEIKGKILAAIDR